MESERFVVELQREVIGVAVRVRGGFLFFSSDRRFEKLDGVLFPRTRAILHRLQEFEIEVTDEGEGTPNPSQEEIK